LPPAPLPDPARAFPQERRASSLTSCPGCQLSTWGLGPCHSLGPSTAPGLYPVGSGLRSGALPALPA
ncbi:unnamed protein product, partial [Rangifer tarandus platyrhynchus]